MGCNRVKKFIIIKFPESMKKTNEEAFNHFDKIFKSIKIVNILGEWKPLGGNLYRLYVEIETLENKVRS